MGERQRQRRNKDFKFKDALEAIRNEKQVNEIAAQYSVHPTMRMHRLIGNQAAQRLHQAEAEGPERRFAATAEKNAIRPLESPIRARLENLLGIDLSDIRLHSGVAADTLLASSRAVAATKGKSIFFPSVLRQESNFDLLVHELAHVAQQTARAETGTTAQLENDAEHVAAKLVQGKKAAPRYRVEPSEKVQLHNPTWKGYYGDPAEFEKTVRQVMARQGLSRKAAEEKVKGAIEQAGKAMEGAHPGLQNKKYSYDVLQDIVIGQDRKMPNCFGDVCTGGKRNWEPTEAELKAWLSANGYKQTQDVACQAGVQKVAVYTLHMTYRDGFGIGNFIRPIHIAELLPDCRWRSRMGGLGVIFHESLNQIWSQKSGEIYAQTIAQDNGVTFVNAKIECVCYERKYPSTTQTTERKSPPVLKSTPTTDAAPMADETNR